jgi:drug/metabolite transporter (DMT)-like permease
MIDPGLISLAAAASFGLGLVLTQFGLRHLPAFAGAAVSLPTTAVAFWLAAPFGLDVENWRGDAALLFLALGLIFPAAVTILTFEANRRMGPTITGTAGSTSPLFALAAGLILLAELPTAQETIAILAIVGGIVLLTYQAKGQKRMWEVRDLALPIGAAALRGAALAVMKIGLALWPSAFAASLLGYTASASVMLANAGRLGGVATLRLGWRGAPWFALVGLCNGFGAFAMYEAIKHIPVAVVASIVATYPLFTLVLGALVLRSERITLARVAGVALTVGGVILLVSR